MEWVLHPNVTATATEKMGIMEIGGGVHTVSAMENKKDFIYFAVAFTV